jgi:hypothetical protein
MSGKDPLSLIYWLERFDGVPPHLEPDLPLSVKSSGATQAYWKRGRIGMKTVGMGKATAVALALHDLAENRVTQCLSGGANTTRKPISLHRLLGP